MEKIKAVFNLKAGDIGTSVPYIYGGCHELGDGDMKSGIQMEKCPSSYNWTVTIFFNQKPDRVWYRYAVKTRLGGMSPEFTPMRYLTLNSDESEILDSYGENKTFDGVCIMFRVHYVTHWGQELFVLGDVPELGSWVQRDAKKLSYAGDGFWTGEVVIPTSTNTREISFRYFVTEDRVDTVWESGEDHKILIDPTSTPALYEVNDCFRWADPVMDSLSRSPFCTVLHKRYSIETEHASIANKEPDTVKVRFSIICPLTDEGSFVVVTGSCHQLGYWNPHQGIRLNDSQFPLWTAVATFHRSQLPIEYKYVVLSNTTYWESRFNRFLTVMNKPNVDISFPLSVSIHDWYPTVAITPKKGAGIAITLAGLRTESSCGIGQFGDLCRMVDLCKSTGLSLIQLLPIFDTSGSSDPFAQTSSFAFNPVYIDLLNVLPNTPPSIITEVRNHQDSFESNSVSDYSTVYEFKMSVLKRLYREADIDAPELLDFLEANRIWLLPYALFSLLSEQYRTSDFTQWPDYSNFEDLDIEKLFHSNHRGVMFFVWLQFIAQRQYLEAKAYANERRVAIKGDFSIEIRYNSAEAWAWPFIFKDAYVGEPPTAENPQGVNTGMRVINFSPLSYRWWSLRLARMNALFDALTVEHMERLFGEWEIPLSQSLHATLGHFSSSRSYSLKELKDMDLWDMRRYQLPYVRGHLLPALFGDRTTFVASTFMTERGRSGNDTLLQFKPQFNSEQAIHNFLLNTTLTPFEQTQIEMGLFDLLSNVLLIQSEDRIYPKHISSIQTSSWEELPEPQRTLLLTLSRDNTYIEDKDGANIKLQMFRRATQMLLCGDDRTVYSPELLRILADNAFLSLHIQRHPKVWGLPFDNIRDLPYFSVCTPSTFDMPSLREWWEENHEVIEEFWKREIIRWDSAPETLEPWIQEIIIKQHLWAASMWSIFQLQDLTGMEQSLRFTKPQEERIYRTDHPNGDTQFRYPFTVEQLQEHSSFVSHLRELLALSGRST